MSKNSILFIFETFRETYRPTEFRPTEMWILVSLPVTLRSPDVAETADRTA